MPDTKKETSVILELLHRFENQRLPRALALKDKVDNGNVLSDIDVDYLDRILKDVKLAQPLIARHPEYAQILSQAFDLYKEITSKALENETR
ncbi:MAG: hypothetical protein ACC707_15265 [Thiohalomonadales bacterium]